MTTTAASTVRIPALFKSCNNCETQWDSLQAFIQDPAIHLVGYMPTFDELTEGLFLFNHRCGTTLACTVGQFVHLTDGPVYQTNRNGEDGCPGHCLNKTDLAPCPQRCSCAFVRETLHIIDRWPKTETLCVDDPHRETQKESLP